MKPLRTSAIIHTFALAHVVATVLCRLSGIDDSLLLTLFTMALTILICFKHGVSVEFTAASVVMVNITGYLIGTGWAWLISRISGSELIVHALSTFLTTELLGWGTVGMIKLFRIGGRKRNWTPRVKWLLMAVALVFLLRLAYTELFSSRFFSAESSYRIISLLLNNSVAILLMLSANIIYIRLMRKKCSLARPAAKYTVFIIFVVSTSALTALLAGFDLPFSLNTTFTTREFILLFTIALIAELMFYCLTYMADYAVVTRSAMYLEREKAHQAQYQYLRLKQQVNPHFLFNSLNILDCLVCEGKSGQASNYIHKLAGMYRYMLQNETSTLVPLQDEIDFVTKYVDMLKVRFPEGIDLKISVPQELMTLGVVPCAIQMLVENAIKHNIANKDNILHITVTARDRNITVSNNITPKLSAGESTRIGLTNIRQQYTDLCGEPITVSDTGGQYTVTLPLLDTPAARAADRMKTMTAR